MKFLAGLFLSFLAITLHADPAPFGLVINKTTIKELKNGYAANSLGFNKNSQMETFDLEPSSLNFAGLISAKAAFSADKVLKLVQVSLPANKFDEIFNSLNKKYHFLYKNTPLDGNKEAKFEQGSSYIVLYAMKGSDEMDILYMNKGLLDEIVGPVGPSTSKKTTTDLGQL